MATLALLACLSLCLKPCCAAMTVVDMTFDLSEHAVFWPGSPPFNFTHLSRGQSSASYWYESNYVSTPEHAGTHVDAPAHFYEGSWRVHQIPASHLVGPAAVMDVSEKAAADPDYRLTVGDVQAWETTHGRIPDKAVVLMNSGRDVLYPNASLVFGTDTPTDSTTFHFPGIHPDAAIFLTEQRSVIAVGVDTPSTDYGPSTLFETHVILGGHNVLGLENVRNLGQLPPRGAIVMVGLPKLYDGSGGPARILAVIDDDTSGTGSSLTLKLDALLGTALILCLSLIC